MHCFVVIIGKAYEAHNAEELILDLYLYMR